MTLTKDIHKLIIKDMFRVNTMHDSYKAYHAPCDFPLLPAISYFAKFQCLCIKEPPYPVPPLLQRFGKYVVCPFNYETVKNISAADDKFTRTVAGRTRHWPEEWDGSPAETQLLSELARIILRTDTKNPDTPFKSLVKYVAQEFVKANPKTKMNEAKRICEDGYIEFAASLIKEINPDFLSCVLDVRIKENKTV